MKKYRISTNGIYYRVEAYKRHPLLFWRRAWISITGRLQTLNSAERKLANLVNEWQPVNASEIEGIK